MLACSTTPPTSPAEEPLAEEVPAEEPADENDSPDEHWTRARLNTYAEDLGIDAEGLPNKDAVLDAIRAAEAQGV